MRNDIRSILSKHVAGVDLDDVTERVIAVLSKELKKKTTSQKKLGSMLLDATKLTYTSDEYKDLWLDWLEYKAIVKKDVYLNPETQQTSLNKLMQYDIRFATQIVTDAKAAGYKGFHFTNTPIIYEQWKRAAVQSAGYSSKELSYAQAAQRAGQVG